MQVISLAVILCTVLQCTLCVLESEYEEFVFDQEPLKWVKHLKDGDVIFAKDFNMQEMISFVEKKQEMEDGTSCFRTQATDKGEDGSVDIHELEDPEDYFDDKIDAGCEAEVTSLYYYPEYAVGLLENGCTAFLVGPFHALTSARCVYNQPERLWEKELKFFRAGNGTDCHQTMEWDEVYIPKLYFDTNDIDFDWALIVLRKEQPSPVWHSLQYCPDQCPGPIMTLYGYKSTVLFSKTCNVQEYSDCYKHLEMNCCESVQYQGGPVFQGYAYNGDKYPAAVVGVNLADYSKGSLNSKNQVAMRFDSDMFWSVCYFVSMTSNLDPEEYCFKM